MRALTIAYIVWMKMLRRKDIYVLLILLGALLSVLLSIDVFGLKGTTAYIKDVGLLFAWIFSWILAVTLGSRELPEEESRGTVYPLLAKPVSRGEVIVGKWLGAWTTVCAATGAFYLLVGCVVAATGEAFQTGVAVQGFLLHCIAVAILCAISLLCSTRMHHDAAATLSFVVSGTAFLLVPRIPEFIARQAGGSSDLMLALYYLMPHFELFDMRRRLVHDYGPIGWGPATLIMAYGLMLTAAFLVLAWITYRNKKFSRGSLG